MVISFSECLSVYALHVLSVCREKAPGQRECDDAIEVLNSCIREVDQASLAAISQQLTPREDISMEVNTHTHTRSNFQCYVVNELFSCSSLGHLFNTFTKSN